MEYVKLGNTGLEVSKLGFGGIPIQRITIEETIGIFGELLNQGINFIDTARGYTVSEEYIGEALEVHGRENFILATKTMSRTYEDFVEDVNISLRNMKTDYIDLYQFHNVSKKADLDIILGHRGALEAALDLVKEGKIGHIGITSHNKDLLAEMIDSGKFETIQFPFNPVESQGEEFLKRAVAEGIGTICMKPLAGGAIMNKPLSMRYIHEQDFINSMIPGMDSVAQVRENAGVINNPQPLNKEEMKILQEEVDELGSCFCRRCGYCAPCTVGIDIPANFLMEGYYTRYNLQEWSTGRYNSMEKNAADCIKCGVCEPRCPYDLPIMDMMDRVEEVFKS